MKLISVIPAIGMFVFLALKLESPKPSAMLGILAICIAVGVVNYFMLNGTDKIKSGTAFGITSNYRGYSGVVIPQRIVIYTLASISACCIFGFGLYTYGI